MIVTQFLAHWAASTDAEAMPSNNSVFLLIRDEYAIDA